MPTTSPGWIDVEVERLERFVGDARLAECAAGVAPARTNSQRGVMTPTPNER